MAQLHISGDPEADALISRDPLSLLVAMLLDQQIPMEKAFRGPHVLRERLGHLDAVQIAAMDPPRLAEVFATPPAVHRFPGSMAGRCQQLCQAIVEHYDGTTDRIWRDAADGPDLLARVQALPGFGRQKAQIFLALLGKQLGVRPDGWREAAGVYGAADVRRSVADVTSAQTLLQVRAYKQQAKAQAKQAARRGAP